MDISWEKDITGDNIFTLSKLSSNEERVVSSRVRGNLIIIINDEKLSMMIHWGEFANISKANIYYNLNNYGFHEGNWPMSKDGKTSFCPDPELLLMEILSTDTLIIGLRPKNNNEIRYVFHTSDLNKMIYENIEFFNLVSNLFSKPFDSPAIPDKHILDTFYNKEIRLKRDVRFVKGVFEYHDNYFFYPIWFMDSLSKHFQLESEDEGLFYFNRWLKKKGTLFTKNDIRNLKFLNKKPMIIPYDSIYNVFFKGNTILGYKLYINDKYFTRLSSTNATQLEGIVYFLKNRITHKVSS